MSKKILLIIGIIAVVGVAVFFIFFSKPQSESGGVGGFSLRNFLPFGNSDDTGTTEPPTNISENPPDTKPVIGTENQPVPRLRKLSGEPVSGAVIFNIGTTSVVRFVEKGTGNVYEATSKSAALQRLTNTTIPKIIRSFWLPNGSGFLAQTIVPESEVVETSFVKLNKNATSSASESLTPFSTTIAKLPTGIKEIAVKPDGAKIFYYTISGSRSEWYTANPDGTGASLLITHPLTEWLPKWVSGNLITMQTKGSFAALSYRYSFDTVSKVLKKMDVNAAGISSETGTLAEKCLQLKDKNPTLYCAIPNEIPSGNYPDVWYQGLVEMEDSIKKIDPINDIYYNLMDLAEESGQKIDAVDLALSPDETHLIFRNKIDGYLWMLRIEE